MIKKNARILCYLDSDRGRDFEILLPLTIYAQKILGCIVDFAFIFDGHAIYRKKPDIVIMSNTVGSLQAFKLAKYAVQNGIKVFALTSEGNFRTNGTFDYWGYNLDKDFMQEYVCLWSLRTLEFLQNAEPKFKHKIVLTGGTGFDRYTAYKFADKITFLTPYKLSHFTKVIGYAGWAFGKMYNKQGRQELIEGGYSEERFIWLEQQRVLVEDILRQAIEQHPDILFILKRHPNEANPSITGKHVNEMVNLAHYPNVLYLYQNENIHDIINISDIWTSFESTTCLESWLMGKPNTVLLNPDPNFTRDELYKGSVILNNYQQFNNTINEFYQTGKIEACTAQNLIEIRKKLIADTIGFADGLNHVRAGKYLQKTIDTLDNKNIKVKFNTRYFIDYMLMHIGKYFYCKKIFLQLPKFKKTIWIFDNYSLKGLPAKHAEYSGYLTNFYKQKGVTANFEPEL